MAGGSTESQNDDDQQCMHCGLWFHPAGRKSHEDNCPWRESDARMVELTDPFAVSRVDDVEAEPGPDPGPDPTPDPSDGPGPSDDDPAPVSPGERELEDDRGGPDASTASTDGGMEPPTDWEDAAPSTDPDPAEAGCPSCGSTESIPIDALPDEVVEALREQVGDEPEQLCAPCSTDADGNIKQTVEVY